MTRAVIGAEIAPSHNTTGSSASDDALIARIANGDQLAMRALYARHRVAVFRFALRKVADATMAEDVLQDVFLDVWRQASRFEGRSSVSTWLLAIARFKSLSALRRRADAELDKDTAELISDPADDPERMLDKKDLGTALRRAIGQLSPNHAEVIDLVYYHNKSVAEVSEITGSPEATVKTRMFYARKKLAALVEAA